MTSQVLIFFDSKFNLTGLKMISTFGSRLERLRKDNDLTLDQVGKIVDTGRAAAHTWVNDKAIPNAKATLLLARHFNVSPYYLIFGENDTEQLNSRFNKLMILLKKISQLEKNNKLTEGNLNHLDIILESAIDSIEKKLNEWIEENDDAKKTA